jgi:hypothetical protein
MPIIEELEYERAGSGRPLVLLSPAPPPELVEALASHFEVFAFKLEGEQTLKLKRAFELLRIERPLLVTHGGASTAITAKRIPRGIVVIGSADGVSNPKRVLDDAELASPGRIAEQLSELDRTLA